MSGIEIIGIILAIGLVSMVEICAIVICVNKMIDQKMRTKCDLELKVFKEEMNYLSRILDPFVKALTATFQPEQKNKEEKMTE